MTVLDPAGGAAASTAMAPADPTIVSVVMLSLSKHATERRNLPHIATPPPRTPQPRHGEPVEA
ncbi:MAG: hypothetical protein AMXMBFR61_20820 [Fimbriimonadales bacterium]